MNDKLKTAFTLIELLVVIAIIGILSGLIIVGMSSSTNSARIAKSQIFNASLRDSLLMNIVAEWKLDQVNSNITSDSWSSNNCTLSGSPLPTLLTSGCVYNNCLSFNGTTAYLDCGGSTTFNLYPITISTWIKTTDTGNNKGIVNKYVSSSVNGYQIFISSGRIKSWYFRDGANFTRQDLDVDDGGIVNDGNWHSIVYAVDVNSSKIYVDGNLKNSKVWTGTPGVTTTAQIVALGSYGAVFYNGLIDDTRIYNAAMPVSMVKEYYYLGLNKLITKGELGYLEYKDMAIGI